MHLREKLFATFLVASLCLNAAFYLRRESPNRPLPTGSVTISDVQRKPSIKLTKTPEEVPSTSSQAPSTHPQVERYGLWFFDPSTLPKEIKTIRASNGAMANGRKLTDTAARIIGLDAAEKQKAQSALDEAFASAEALLIKNVVPASDSGPGLDEFVVTANPEAATSILSQLSSSLANALGESKASNLVNSIDFNQYFAGMGLLDARISFEDLPEDPANPSSALHTHVKYTLRDPKSGGVAFASGGFFEGLSERFGSKIFARAAPDSRPPASDGQ